MKQIKRIMAFALALVLTLAMSITVFAEETDSSTAAKTTPSKEDKATITVSNVEKGATVTAYQYVKATYNDADTALTGYVLVDAVKDAEDLKDIKFDSTSLTPENLIALADLATAGKLTGTTLTAETDDPTIYTASVPAGSYVILVSGTTSEIYNPMVASLYYSVGGSDNTILGGTVSADANLTLNDTDVYAKSAKPNVTKEIVSVTGQDNNADTTDKYDAAIGDTVAFKITTTIPDYSKAYTYTADDDNTFTFKLVDTLSKGFDNVEVTSATIGDTVIDENLITIAETDKTEKTITVDLSSVALSNANETVTIEYTAVLTDDAVINSDATETIGNTNTVVMTYSTSPDTDDTSEATATTHTYTFKLNDVSADAASIITKYSDEKNDDGTNIGLQGATFTLINTTTQATYTAVSDEDGAVSFTSNGLDAGTYTLQETEAPEGYSLNDTIYYVVISATYDSTDEYKIDSLSVEFYEDSALQTIVTGNKAEITDTKLAVLPSTGGIGTTIFTVVGSLIMIAAAGMYFASRRRNAR